MSVNEQTISYIDKQIELFIQDSIESYYQEPNSYRNLFEYIIDTFMTLENTISKIKGKQFSDEFKKRLLKEIMIFDDIST